MVQPLCASAPADEALGGYWSVCVQVLDSLQDECLVEILRFVAGKVCDTAESEREGGRRVGEREARPARGWALTHVRARKP